MKQLLFGFILLTNLSILAQSDRQSDHMDLKYLEDQFYLGITYNSLLNKPTDFTQRNLSYGYQRYTRKCRSDFRNRSRSRLCDKFLLFQLMGIGDI